MKTVIKFAAILLLVGCTSKNGDEKLAELITKRDSLKKEYKKLGQELKGVEEEISAMDTTKRLTPVTTAKPDAKEFLHYFDVRGTVKAEKNTLIYPEVPGNVKAIKVTEGNKVTKGQILMVLDTEVVESQIKQVKTSLELAKTLYDKQKALYEKGIGSEVQYLQAKTNKESLEANLKSLTTQKSKSFIAAPFNGIVDAVVPTIGTLVGPQMPVIRLVSLGKVYVEADVSERYIQKINKGTEVIVKFPILDKVFDAKLQYRGNYINENNRTFKVRVDINNNKNNQFKPNMVSVLQILDYRKENAVVLPASMVQQDAVGKDFVYTVKKNTLGENMVAKTYLETGMSYMGETEIVSGLSASDEVVDKGSRSIKNGQKVEIVTE